MFNAKERSDSNRITGVWSINQSKNRNKEGEKQMKIEELERIIQEHKEDLEFHLLLLQEFGKIEKNTDEYAVTTEEEEVVIETRLIDSEQSPQKLTRARYQEQKGKVRV
jgi:hypothetical protein